MTEFWHHYLEIMSDPAHLMAEVSLMLLVDVLFLGLIWPFIANRLHRAVDVRVEARVTAEHHVIDAEHGITHNPDGTVSLPFTHTVLGGHR